MPKILTLALALLVGVNAFAIDPPHGLPTAIDLDVTGADINERIGLTWAESPLPGWYHTPDPDNPSDTLVSANIRNIEHPPAEDWRFEINYIYLGDQRHDGGSVDLPSFIFTPSYTGLPVHAYSVTIPEPATMPLAAFAFTCVRTKRKN